MAGVVWTEPKGEFFSLDDKPTCVPHCMGITALSLWPTVQIISIATGNGFITNSLINGFLGILSTTGLIIVGILVYPNAVALKSKCCNRREYTQIKGSDQIALKPDSLYLKRHGIEQV
ncbi:MAG: hypothetical protein K1000chlam3_01339 [Chlamydiae bacterium]|nr:hypothetical protein [Chlamydiota bacterium]